MPPPPTPTDLLTDRAGVEQVLGRTGVDVRLDIDRTTVVSAAEEAILTFCLNYGSEFVYNRAGGRYSFAQLALSWEVYQWASVVAAHLLCLYRVGAIPAALQAEFEAVAGPDGSGGKLGDVMSGKFRPFAMASRSGTGVSYDAVRLDGRYSRKQIRVETSISDGPRTQLSPQIQDIGSRYIVEWDR